MGFLLDCARFKNHNSDRRRRPNTGFYGLFITLILLFIHWGGFSKYEMVFSGHIKSIVRGLESGINNK